MEQSCITSPRTTQRINKQDSVAIALALETACLCFGKMIALLQTWSRSLLRPEFKHFYHIKKRVLEHQESWALSAHLYHLDSLLKSTVVPCMAVFLLEDLNYRYVHRKCTTCKGILSAEVAKKVILVLSAWRCDSLAHCCNSIASVGDAVCLSTRWKTVWKNETSKSVIFFKSGFIFILHTL